MGSLPLYPRGALGVGWHLQTITYEAVAVGSPLQVEAIFWEVSFSLVRVASHFSALSSSFAS